ARIQPHPLVVLTARQGAISSEPRTRARAVLWGCRGWGRLARKKEGHAMAHRIPLAAVLALALVGVAQAQDSLGERLERLEAEVRRAEDVSALKRLQRVYGYYVDKGMWE